jgi:EpsI family protein
LLVLSFAGANFVENRVENIPNRTTLASFPLLRADWIGRETAMEPDILAVLNYPDYIMSQYRQRDDAMPVDFYIAYYESQRAGSSIHSPRACIPGGGWEISSFEQENMDSVPGLSGLAVNRLIISKGEYSQLVYYWFAMRGRVITNEYMAKWYSFVDGMTIQRTDGALVRLVTVVPPGTDIALADARLQKFLQDFYPVLPRYLPGGDALLQLGNATADDL